MLYGTEFQNWGRDEDTADKADNVGAYDVLEHVTCDRCGAPIGRGDTCDHAGYLEVVLDATGEEYGSDPDTYVVLAGNVDDGRQVVASCFDTIDSANEWIARFGPAAWSA